MKKMNYEFKIGNKAGKFREVLRRLYNWISISSRSIYISLRLNFRTIYNTLSYDLVAIDYHVATPAPVIC
jgi:hypothetical protein